MYVVFDIETTGFDASSCDIIEFAYAAFTDDGVFVKAERLYFYYKGMSWSEEAYGVHQIPLSFLETQEDKFKENLIKMYSILNRNTVVGFNCQAFDCPFAITWLRRQGIYGLTYHRIKDVMLSYKPITKRPRIKLTKLIELMGLSDMVISNFADQWFGSDSNGLRSHEASYDVAATALLTFMAVNKKLMTFAYADTQETKVDINPDEEFGVFNETDQQEEAPVKNGAVIVQYANDAGAVFEKKLNISGLTKDISVMGLTHVGTKDSQIYCRIMNDGTPITFDAYLEILRICYKDNPLVVRSVDDCKNLETILGGDD